MSMRINIARDHVVATALSYASASWWYQTNPGDSSGVSDLEYRADALDDALSKYVDEVNRERAGKLES